MENGPAEVLEERRFLGVLTVGIVSGFFAYFIGSIFNIDFAALIKWSLSDIAIALLGAVPLIGGLYAFMNVQAPKIAAFRKDQIEYFAAIGFEFTPFRIALIALCAGVFEELLFRGVLQQVVAIHTPLWVSLIVTNVVFGALHWRNVTYASIAGIVGLYLGIIFALTNNLLVVIIIHALYDVVALAVTRSEIIKLRNRKSD